MPKSTSLGGPTGSSRKERGMEKSELEPSGKKKPAPLRSE
jgi:hypothetical protein